VLDGLNSLELLRNPVIRSFVEFVVSRNVPRVSRNFLAELFLQINREVGRVAVQGRQRWLSGFHP